MAALRRVSARFRSAATTSRLLRAGKNFSRDIAPRVFRKFLLRASARKAAKRAASLVPLAGWAFAGADAYNGVEDIFRGRAARGIAGIGMAIADVASDFLHLGDAISGVGGTALSLGAQGALMAGQIKVELDRAQEKLEALSREIESSGKLPSGDRLKTEYELDDDAIAELKREYETPSDWEEPSEQELPPPPAYMPDDPQLWSPGDAVGSDLVA
jgi:hypothetical protein